MKTHLVDGVEVHRGSGNVFADLGLADAEKLKIKTGLVVEIRKAMRSRGLTQQEAAGTVAETLDFWLYECSIDEAPAAAEVAQWRDILAARGGKFTRLAQICQTWLDEECA